MRTNIITFALALGALFSTPAMSQVTPHEGIQDSSCEQIRAEIKAHVGTPSTPNTNLLHKLSGRTECKFSASEAYRAAFGDRTKSPIEQGVAGHRHHDDERD
jgi:hypothetical protein